VVGGGEGGGYQQGEGLYRKWRYDSIQTPLLLQITKPGSRLKISLQIWMICCYVE
jgi:hypothetical protein